MKKSVEQLGSEETMDICSESDLPGTSQQDSDESRPSSASAVTTNTNYMRQSLITKNFQEIKSFGEGGEKFNAITNSILFMICKDMQPFSIVESEGFRQLMKLVVPQYKIPSRQTLTRRLDAKYDSLESVVKVKLSFVDSVAITTDIWSDTMQIRSFLGITVHYASDGKMFSFTLGVCDLEHRHTAEYLAEKLMETCNQWNIPKEKITAVVTDNGANIVKAVHIAFGKHVHMACCAHTLNLVAEKSIDNTGTLKGLIGKVKLIVTWFKHSIVASDELRRRSSKKLIQEVPTRWNSKYYMLKRFLELRSIINEIISNHISAPAMVTAFETQEIEEVTRLLQPLEVATKELCGENYVTDSKIIPMIHCLSKKISEMSSSLQIAKDLQKSLTLEINQRFGNVEEIRLMAVSTILDPRFKKIHFQNLTACSTAVEHLETIVKSLTSPLAAEQIAPVGSHHIPDEEEEFNLWSQHHVMVEKMNNSNNDGTSEIAHYLKCPLKKFEQNPLQLWDDIKGICPTLAKIAPKYLSIPATSVPSERLFSKAGQVLTQQRGRKQA
ncbi:E3 SUMO-protein ligase ZBED1-like [Onthophagus taurus]|uniref:E3 SUMO-protein ligase ZBED1-like n=1 Tax=Onthophagus taurus TaxID=166361 RepID=UPI0039BECC6C